MKRFVVAGALLVCVLAMLAPATQGREWSSPGGHYKLEADAIAFNDSTVVLKKKSNGKLVAVELAELCDADREFVKSREAIESMRSSADMMQTWTSSEGLKVRGRVLGYGRKELAIKRQVGRVFVNGTRFSSLDSLHQQLVLKIMSALEVETYSDEKDLERWAKKLGAEEKTYPLQGVLLELESGDQIGVPFFMFSQEDLAILEPGWKNWLESEKDREEQERESLMVQTRAMEYQRDRQQQQHIEMLKLDLLATATGIISIWEVMLTPGPGVMGYPTSVMVPADNSRIANQIALQRYPGYRTVGVRRASF